MEQPQFFPNSVNHEWDATEIHPVRNLGDGNCETIDDPDEEHEADFWSVYVHHVDPAKYGSLSCIADVDTEQEAVDLDLLIRRLMKNFKP